MGIPKFRNNLEYNFEVSKFVLGTDLNIFIIIFLVNIDKEF